MSKNYPFIPIYLIKVQSEDSIELLSRRHIFLHRTAFMNNC